MVSFKQAKGRAFEALVQNLIKKAGFIELRNCEQITDTGKFHGRGATHQIDAFGEFEYTIPFAYPIRLIAEAKATKYPINVAVFRNHVGVMEDIKEWYRIETRTGGAERYQPVARSRYYDCAAIFSLSGFRKSAEEYGYAHGILAVSYENNKIITKLFGKLKGLLLKTGYGKMRSNQVKKLTQDVYLSKTIPQAPKTGGLDGQVTKFKEYLDDVGSLFGMMSGRYPINILFEKSKQKESKLSFPSQINAKLKFSSNRFIITSKKPYFKGEFSISKNLLKYYLLAKYKRNYEYLAYIDVALPEERKVSRFTFDKTETGELLDDIKNIFEKEKGAVKKEEVQKEK